MNRLNLLCCIVAFILLAVSCDNGQLTAECIDDEVMKRGEGVQTNETASVQKRQTKQGSAKVIPIPVTDYSITDTTIDFTGTTLIYWFPPKVMSKFCTTIVKQHGWQYFHEGIDAMACFEVIREKSLQEKGVHFVKLNAAYSTLSVKGKVKKKHLVLDSLMYKPGLIVLRDNRKPILYPLIINGCENISLEKEILEL
jgi:hypothetical protein